MINFKSIPFAITTDTFMKGVFSIIGKTNNASGCALHELNSIITGLLPEFLKDRIIPVITWNLVNVLGFKKAD